MFRPLGFATLIDVRSAATLLLLLLLASSCVADTLGLDDLPPPGADAGTKPIARDASAPNEPDAGDNPIITPCAVVSQPFVVAEGIIRHMALSPAGTALALITYGGDAGPRLLRVFHFQKGLILERTGTNLDTVQFDGFGRTLILQDGATITTIDVETGQERVLSTSSCRHELMSGGTRLAIVEAPINCTAESGPLGVYGVDPLSQFVGGRVDTIQPWTFIRDLPRNVVGYRKPNNEIWYRDLENGDSTHAGTTDLRPLGFPPIGLLAGGQGDSLSCPEADIVLLEHIGLRARTLGRGCATGFNRAHPYQRASIGRHGVVARTDRSTVSYLPYNPSQMPVIIAEDSHDYEHHVAIVGPENDEHVVFNTATRFMLAPVARPEARRELFQSRIEELRISRDRLKLAYAKGDVVYFGPFDAPVELMRREEAFVVSFLPRDRGIFFRFGRPNYPASEYSAPLYFAELGGEPKLIDEDATGWFEPVADVVECVMVYGRKRDGTDEVVVTNVPKD